MPFMGWLSDLLEGLSDHQIGGQKVTLNHLFQSLPPLSFVLKTNNESAKCSPGP